MKITIWNMITNDDLGLDAECFATKDLAEARAWEVLEGTFSNNDGADGFDDFETFKAHHGNELAKVSDGLDHEIMILERTIELPNPPLVETSAQATPEQIRKVSRDYRRDDDFEIRDDAPTMKTERGTFVQAWVLIEPAGEEEKL